MKFQPGDRVTVINDPNNRDARSDLPPGIATGTVVDYQRRPELVAVSWDGFCSGHDCDGKLPQGDKSGWRMYEKYLELVKEDEVEELSFGDVLELFS